MDSFEIYIILSLIVGAAGYTFEGYQKHQEKMVQMQIHPCTTTETK